MSARSKKTMIACFAVVVALSTGVAHARRSHLYPNSQSGVWERPRASRSGAGSYQPQEYEPIMRDRSTPASPVSVPRRPKAPIPAITASASPDENVTGEGDPIEANVDMRREFSDIRTNEYLDFEYGAGEEEEEIAPGLLGHFGHGHGPIAVEYLYTGEVFTNMRGGLQTRNATTYFGLFEMVMTADVEEMGLFPGGEIFLYALNGHGRGISEYYVGDAQVLSNIEIPFESQIFQVEEYWWERTFCDDTFMFRIGKQDVNYDFAVVEVAGDFINSSFGFHPTIPMPSYPDAAMGVMGHVLLTDSFLFRAGVWDGAANGKTWGFSGTGETFSMYEFEKLWNINGHPGEFHVGFWYHSGDFPYLDGTPGAHSGSHGVNIGGEHFLWKENCCPDDTQGLAVFGQWGWAPQRYSQLEAHQYLGTGLVYQGLLPNRDDDITGLAMAQIRYADFFPNMEEETAIELFHKFSVGDYIMIQPDLQFICNPGGTGRDAFVAGVRFEVLL